MRVWPPYPSADYAAPSLDFGAQLAPIAKGAWFLVRGLELELAIAQETAGSPFHKEREFAGQLLGGPGFFGLGDPRPGEQNETVGIGSRAVEGLSAVILEAQTWDVDATAGATVSSDVIRAAVRDCVEQAGLA